ncbi:protein kinase C1 [Gorgonomyces haynaldii]|nr:protein kinase C1 [Gorgonomyces haynaldii]
MEDVEKRIAELRGKIDIERKFKEGAQYMLPKLTEKNARQQCEQNLQVKRFNATGIAIEDEFMQETSLKDLGQASSLEAIPETLSTPPTKGKSVRKQNTTTSTQESPFARFLRNDTHYNQEKVRYRLQQAITRLNIERRVLEGTQRMLDATQEGDSKIKDATQEKLKDCEAKVFLLELSRKRYESIALVDTPSSQGSDLTESTHAQKGGYTGRFKVKIISASGLPGKKSSKSSVFVTLQIDNNQKGKTRSSNTNSWTDEFIVQVERANDVELTVYEDEQGKSLLGLVWFKFADLLEELSLETEPKDDQISSGDLEPTVKKAGEHTKIFWLDLVPNGKICVGLKFVKEEPKKRTDNTALVRQKAVKKVIIKRGHKFAAFTSYQVLKCASCQEFLVSGQGYRCELCSYVCHRKCQGNILAKCISKASGEKDDPEYSIINHQIPHRFQKASGAGVAWCAHCGLMAMSLKNFVKCTECSTYAHESCSVAIPAYCGLPAGMLDAIRDIEKFKKQKKEQLKEKPEKPDEVDQSDVESVKSYQSNNTAKTAASSAVPSADNLVDSNPPSKQMLPAHAISYAASVPVLTIDPAPSTPKGRASVGHIPSSKAPRRNDSVSPFKGGPRGVTLEDFKFAAVLGKGNFGKVMLAQEKFTNQYYAIKVLKKEFILEHDEVESTKSEKRCFQVATKMRHPFLVNLHSCFQTESRLYFVMEFVNGGDLMWHIQRGRFSAKQARFYACEVLLALHDLKLDNILLTQDGHIKLADYGLCKERMKYGSTTNTFCGTPEFMAPEILQEKPYSRAAPFSGDTEDKIFNAILKEEPNYPSSLSADALLTKDPQRRLGSSRNDGEDIKQHYYFQGTNWDDVLQKRIPPPYTPRIVLDLTLERRNRY